MMRLLAAVLIVGFASAANAQSVALRASDGRTLQGDLYGAGPRGLVILAHGGYSTRASWRPAAEAIAEAGFHVLVIESRAAADLAAGNETPCLYDEVCLSRDVIAAISHLRRIGAKAILLMGGSIGGAAVAQAAIDLAPNPVEGLVLLAPAEVTAPEKIPGRKLIVVTANDANAAGLRLPGIKAQFARMTPPKDFKLLDGSAHGQLILATADGAAVRREIIRFLQNGRP